MSSRYFVSAAAALLLVLALGTRADAQTSHEHRGFWLAGGLGGGLNASTGLDGASLGGFAAYLRLGGTISQRFLLGVEGSGWAREIEDDDVVSRGNGTVVALFYPDEDGGLFLKAGVGGASVSRITTSGNTTTTTTENGFGLTLGVGTEAKIGGNLYLTPGFDWLFQAFDPGEDPLLGSVPNTNSLLLLTLGLTMH